MKKGLITKILHKGQKVYGVITGFEEANVTVRFPFGGVSGTVEICEITIPKSDCRNPLHLGQTAETATLIRSFLGCRWKKKGSSRMGQV
jgi:ribosomal protein S1